MRPRFLVTRPAGQGAALCAALGNRGIDTVHVPTVAIRPADPAALATALGDGPWDWIVVTSVNGVAPLAAAAGSTGMGPRTRVAAVGAPTADALRARGIQVDHVPPRFLTLAIADGLGPVHGSRILLARADAATPDLHRALVERGASVREVVAYRTEEGPAGSRAALHDALAGPLHGITFTSGSTVRGLVALLAEQPAALEAARRLDAACIGPVTAAEAARLGWQPAVIAERHTAIGLADAIATRLAMEISA